MILKTKPVLSIAIALCFVISIGGDMALPLYNRATPMLGDFPFFYWWLLFWMPVDVILLGLIAWMQRRLPAGKAS